MNKVIVTGGAGFIGSYLSEMLVEQGCQVTIIDDLSTGKIDNTNALLRNRGVEFVQGSITDFNTLQKVVKGAEYIFHLAAIPSVPRSIENPQATNNVNVNGTLNVLLAAREQNIRKVVYSSSSSVYGDTKVLLKKEDMAPQPLSPYAVSKLTGEYYCRVFHRVYQLPTVCLRYFNVYGPRQDPASQYAAAIPRFITQVLSGKPVTIYGDGEQTRDFTFVKDAVEANILAAESDASGVYNIGSGENITINHLAKLIAELSGKKMKWVFQDTRAGDVRHSLADISAAKAFGYKPKYNLKDGLIETIGWFNGRHS
ncbi:SDR family oxidoreductase [Chloroflexota bacterium]